jgi:hypothetical protein
METSPFGCFLCNGLDHRQDACPEREPPENAADRQARIDKYVYWAFEEHRIRPDQKRRLIEIVNAAFDRAEKERKAS